jgi:hypothetical protein
MSVIGIGFVLLHQADFAERMVNGRLNRVPRAVCHQSAVYHGNAWAAAFGHKSTQKL